MENHGKKVKIFGGSIYEDGHVDITSTFPHKQHISFDLTYHFYENDINEGVFRYIWLLCEASRIYHSSPNTNKSYPVYCVEEAIKTVGEYTGLSEEAILGSCMTAEVRGLDVKASCITYILQVNDLYKEVIELLLKDTLTRITDTKYLIECFYTKRVLSFTCNRTGQEQTYRTIQGGKD